jgi:CRISPR/Cas system-associated exonuclease Cas4 (RecB family)
VTITNGTATEVSGEVVAVKPYRISNSEIQVYKDCKRKWYLNYYRRLQPKKKRVTGPLALGSRVHNALEEYYENGTPLLDAYAHFLEADRIIAKAEWLDEDELDAEGELGRIMLEGYLEWVEEEGIDSDYDVISNEETLVMPLLDGSVELQGKLDMRVRRKSDGTRLIRDFKTVGQSFDQYTSTLHLNEQVLTYMTLEAYHNTESDRSSGALFTLFKKVKRSARANPPFYDQVEIEHNIFELRSFWKQINGVVQELMKTKHALEEGADHRDVAWKHASGDCKWKCQYFSICQMMDDGSAVEDAISDLYEVGDPNSRYAEDKKGSE